jgi:dihydroorotase
MSDRLENVQVVDPASPYDGQTVSLILEDGIIQSIHPSQEPATAFVSPGWVDLLATSGQPGQEERETWESLALAGIHGGYVQVVVSPEGTPVRDSATGIQSFLAGTTHLPIELLPLGTLSTNAEGLQLAELHQMLSSGAIGFFDAYLPTERAQLLQLGLQYTQDWEVPLISVPFDRSFSPYGMVNESPFTTQLGLKSTPVLAEILRLERDIRILEYAGGRLHFHGVSSAEGVQIIREAKQKGLPITADTTLAHLVFTDEDLAQFDTHLKVFPPLRRPSDQEALWNGLLDGTLDAIASGHRPYDTEHKQVEFDDAAWGMATLEFGYSAFTAKFGTGRQAQSTWVRAVTHGPRALYQLGEVRIVEGSPAELTVFHPDAPAPQRVGKGANYPTQWKLQGAAIALATRGKYYQIQTK